MAFALGAVVAFSPALALAAPGDGETDVRRANLEVDTSAIGTGGPVVQRRIDERANVALRELAVLEGDPDSPTFEIVVSERGAEDPGYDLEVRMLEPGADEPAYSRAVVCALCTETELVARAESEVRAMVPKLDELARTRASSEPEGPAPRPAAPTDASPPSTDVAPDDAAARRMSRAGIGLLAGGLVGVGVGIGLTLAPPRADPDDPRYELSTRNPGLAVVTAGATLAVVGAVLTGIGAGRQRKANTAARRPAVGLSFDRHRLGITMGARF